jgi:hypothetical protein
MVLGVFFLKSDWVAVTSQAEYQFIEDFVTTLGKIRPLKAQVRTTDPALYLARFNRVVRTLGELEAPREWRGVHAEAVRELRRRATRMGLLAMPTLQEQRVAQERWTAIERDIQRLMRVRAGFWTGLPSLPRGTRV